MKRIIYKSIGIALIVLILVTIVHAFYQSSLPPAESSKESSKVGEIIEEIIPPQTPPGQFVQQNQADKVEIGDYPIASVYANFLLKQTRFYVKYYHVNEGLGNRNYFLVPHYPTNQGLLWFGLSWNFYN